MVRRFGLMGKGDMSQPDRHVWRGDDASSIWVRNRAAAAASTPLKQVTANHCCHTRGPRRFGNPVQVTQAACDLVKQRWWVLRASPIR